MGILSMFAPLMTSELTIRKKTTTIGADFVPVVSYVDGDSVRACVYSRTSGESYMNSGMWKSSVSYVAVVEPGLVLSVNDMVRMGDTDYAVDYVDDVAFQGEVTLVGLRGIK